MWLEPLQKPLGDLRSVVPAGSETRASAGSGATQELLACG